VTDGTEARFGLEIAKRIGQTGRDFIRLPQ
jgi:hypothetical protein